MGGCAPRAREDILRPRCLVGASGRPLNFTVRAHAPQAPRVCTNDQCCGCTGRSSYLLFSCGRQHGQSVHCLDFCVANRLRTCCAAWNPRGSFSYAAARTQSVVAFAGRLRCGLPACRNLLLADTIYWANAQPQRRHALHLVLWRARGSWRTRGHNSVCGHAL